jgi:hypothetical protein
MSRSATATLEKPFSVAPLFFKWSFMDQSSTVLLPSFGEELLRISDNSGVQSLANQSASCNNIDEDIINMHLIGVDNYLRIQEISSLEDGWDGDRASAIPSKVLDRVKDLLITLPAGAKIFPTGRKSIQIEYHKNEDNFFELEISSDSYSVYSVKGEEEFEGDVRKRDIKKKVDAFLK